MDVELDHKEGWVVKNWCFWTVVLEKEIKPVNHKGNESWMVFGRTDAETEAPIIWPPDVESWLVRKDSDAGKDWGQEKGMTEDEMIGWHHEHEFEQTLGDTEGQGRLACCGSWGCKESNCVSMVLAYPLSTCLRFYSTFLPWKRWLRFLLYISLIQIE